MRNTLLALMPEAPKPWLVLACAAACSAQAQAASSVTIYGRLNTAIEYTEGSNAGATTRLTNNRSVFGLRGQEDLGGGTQAFWQIESAVSVDSGQGQLAGRNTAVGLQGRYGTLFMGHWQTPYTEATASYDPYYPTTAGYMALIGNGSTSSSDNVQDTSAFDRRQKNIIQYRSPSWNGLTGSMAWGVNEEKISAPRNPGLYSFAANYDRGPLNVTAAYEVHQHYQTAGRNDDAMKIGVAYQFSRTKIALLYERLHYRSATGDLYRNSYYTSVIQQFGPGSLRLGVALVSNGSGNARETIGFFHSGADTGAFQLTVGYDYPLSKRTALYTYYSRINNRSNAIYNFAVNQIDIQAGAHPQTFVLGVRHNF